MIVTLALYLLGYFISFFTLLLPTWQLWPDQVFDAVRYFADGIMSLNSILLVVPVIYIAFVWFLRVLIYYFTFRLLVKIFNYFRGTGDGLG